MVNGTRTAGEGRPPSRASGLLYGIGFGGFVDGIVLHQILQWHHMVSSVDGRDPGTLAGLEANTVADGFFHPPLHPRPDNLLLCDIDRSTHRPVEFGTVERRQLPSDFDVVRMAWVVMVFFGRWVRAAVDWPEKLRLAALILNGHVTAGSSDRPRRWV